MNKQVSFTINQMLLVDITREDENIKQEESDKWCRLQGSGNILSNIKGKVFTVWKLYCQSLKSLDVYWIVTVTVKCLFNIIICTHVFFPDTKNTESSAFDYNLLMCWCTTKPKIYLWINIDIT